MSAARAAAPYRWGTRDDINPAMAFMLDCVVNLFVLSAILIHAFGFPTDLVYGRIIPGAVVGIVVGNAFYIAMTVRMAKRTGNHAITALPLGLDMPTTIAFSFGLMGPLFLGLKHELGDADAAARAAWYIAMGATLWIGVIKAALAFFGKAIQRFVPVAALLGSMFGIAVVWLGANAVLGVMEVAPIGLIALVIMVYTLIGTGVLKGDLPGAVVAILAGTFVYYLLGWSGGLAAIGLPYGVPSPGALALRLPLPSLGGLEEMFGRALGYLAVSAPFALLIAASSINLATAAKLVGDDFNPRQVMLADAAATVASALFGGVVQTTPYFGHTTYKRMGGRAAYSLAVIVVLGVGVTFGVLQFLIDLIPAAVFKPVLIVVAMDIIRLNFQSVPKDHAPAVGFAVMPAILNFAYIQIETLYGRVHEAVGAAAVALPASAGFLMGEYGLIATMARGYILTSLIWGSVVVFLIDGAMRRAIIVLLIAALFTLVGLIHSVDPAASLYWPWAFAGALRGTIPEAMLALPYQIAIGYVLAALTVFFLALARKKEA